MEYVILTPGRERCRYSVLVGAGQVDGLEIEDYGVEILRLRDGLCARAEHVTSSIARIDALIGALIDGQADPEELEAYLKGPAPALS